MALSYENCTLCPRACGVNRAAGALGFCRSGAQIRAARAALHFGEEPCISGNYGAGTVFFSGCTLACTYCQNSIISHELQGELINSSRLREIFEELIDEGAQNINLVTPTHFLPGILPALAPKLRVPVLYNCGGYESVETLRALEGLVDVYLPDMKYSDNALAARLSAAPDYPETAQAAIREMVRQTGNFRLEDGALVRGTLVRHLILPGEIDNSLGVIDWISQEFSRDTVLFSLMAQYTPCGSAANTPPLDREITDREYAAVQSYLTLCGIKSGYLQERTAATHTAIPDFDGTGLHEKNI